MKKFVWTIVLLAIIGVLGYMIFRDKGEETTVEQDETVTETEQESEGSDNTQEEESEYAYEGDTDFSSFSTDEQVLGEESESEFAITGLEMNERDGYHEFLFTLETQEDEEGEVSDHEPFLTASYTSNTGVVRLDFQQISGDDTGIGYQEEESIDVNGVLRIYHNVSAQQDQELYDIGVAKETTFYVSSEEEEEGKWFVTLKVKYPGETSLDLDLGSEEFSDEDQSILGVDADQGAKITSYTYGNPADALLKMVWNVNSDVENPIPNVEASYNEDGDLVVTFSSLTIDRVANYAESMTLSSGITASAEREGDSTIYTFTGMEEDSTFKLSASLSPNQVVLEIK